MDHSKPLKNQRHERFVLGLFAGKTDGQAYIDAGYKPNRGNASVLKTKQNIQGRLAFLRDEAAESAGIDRAWILGELQKV